MPEKFYLTTPIYYVNARPHIGTTYTTVVADAIARRKRSLGIDTFFLTGTDEHGQKIERSAAKAGCSPQEFTDRVSAEFRGLWDRMGLTYDDFIRTTEPRHKQAVQKLFALLRDNGYIYKGSYTGQYCVSDEAYVDVPPGAPCPECGRPTETVNEENYYFKLSAFERKLLEFYQEHPEFIEPETRRNEVISFVKSGLRDLSVSRTSFNWGIPVPGDEKHVIYVWMDALANYITALGWGSKDPSRYDKFWPADLHIVGKEITRFHCVYWPAFLMAAGLPLPQRVVGHGWLLFEENKMSKSRGNIVRAETILDTFGAMKPDLPKAEQDRFGADVLRYFLLREVVFGHDGSFSFDALVQRYNSDLANGYGNLVSRTLAMIGRYFGGVVPELPAGSSAPQASSLPPELLKAVTTFGQAFDALDFSRALETAWAMVAAVDGYLTATAPWKQPEGVSDEQQQALRATVLYTAAESIRIITALVYPAIPESAAKVWAQLGLGDITKANLKDLQWGGLKPGTQLGESSPLFPRADKEAITRMNELENTEPRDQGSEISKGSEAKVQESEKPGKEVRVSKLRSLIDGLAVAASESTNETSAILALESAVAESVREIVGGNAKHPSSPPNLAPGTENPPAAAPAGTPAVPPAPQTGRVVAPAAASLPGGKISIDDFAKVELRVAQIKVAERVPKADKLLRLEVDLGYETRQILAGIAEAYTPESLIGRKVVIVANLAPRKLRGLESNGMIVAASVEGGRAVLAGFLEDVEIGARLK
jgi:methionyl-tRNA synthetase